MTKREERLIELLAFARTFVQDERQLSGGFSEFIAKEAQTRFGVSKTTGRDYGEVIKLFLKRELSLLADEPGTDQRFYLLSTNQESKSPGYDNS